jgi:hypothetical protein
MIKVRINNIECRFSQERYEIVKWQPNQYYGAEERLIEEGYEKTYGPTGKWSMKNGFHSIHESCFANSESCYTIATLKYDKGEGCCDMKTIGNRLLELDKINREDFFKVYELAEEMIAEEEEKEDEDY